MERLFCWIEGRMSGFLIRLNILSLSAMAKPVSKDRMIPVLFAVMIIFFLLSLLTGSSTSSFSELMNLSENATLQKIIFQHRLPRTLTAILTGISLPLSGWVLQEFFRNPLAGPSVLGITSASGLGVAAIIVLGSSLGLGAWLTNSWILIAGALLGAFISLIILLMVASRISSTTSLIIVGFMIAALCGALIGVLEFFASGKELQSYVLWSFGSLNGLTFDQLAIFAGFCLFGMTMIILNIPSLMKMQLGEMYAKTMGVNVRSLRLQLILSASVLTGVTTALVGPVAFIGLAVPHICRMYLKTGDFRKLFFSILLLGITLMLIFSYISEIFPGGSLPINIITALFGAPVVLSIVFRHKGGEL